MEALRPTTITLAPFNANALAVSLPIPDVAPVTTQILLLMDLSESLMPSGFNVL